MGSLFYPGRSAGRRDCAPHRRNHRQATRNCWFDRLTRSREEALERLGNTMGNNEIRGNAYASSTLAENEI